MHCRTHENDDEVSGSLETYDVLTGHEGTTKQTQEGITQKSRSLIATRQCRNSRIRDEKPG